MWRSLLDIFEHHTLLNELTARCKIYTAKVDESEEILTYAYRVRLLLASLGALGFIVDDE